jgi:hypothetical protein
MMLVNHRRNDCLLQSAREDATSHGASAEDCVLITHIEIQGSESTLRVKDKEIFVLGGSIGIYEDYKVHSHRQPLCCPVYCPNCGYRFAHCAALEIEIGHPGTNEHSIASFGKRWHILQ